MNVKTQIATLLVSLSLTACGFASDEKPNDAKPDTQEAIVRGLAIVQKAAANYPKHRECFSCHHQTLPMLAMTAVRTLGTQIDKPLLKEQAEFTLTSFAGRKEQLLAGTGIGGRAMTVAYGLWALEIADFAPDETTAAMVTFLLKTQTPDGSWTFQSNRPPLEASSVMCTVLAAYGLKTYGTDGQKDESAKATGKANAWLETAKLESIEDKAARLWGLKLLGGSDEAIKTARTALLADQREDGGWPQLTTMTSDAYGTGQALWILHETGLPPTDAIYERGVRFLLKTQGDDGAWLVETRSKPVQMFFDNGDPHGKHQFIVIPATSWAIAALAKQKP